MDSYVLTGPQGTQINLGSWIVADSGPDFGEQNLWQQHYSQTPAVDGGVLGFEDAGVRTMKFPLLLPSVGALSGLNGLVGMLREVARPNSTLDVLLDAVATSEAVRFDVLAGRVVPAYDLRVYRARRMPVTVELDTRPYGYWPTYIVLASVASVALPGFVAIPNASILGDAPAYANVTVQPTVGSAIPGTAAGAWMPDAVMWSLGGRASLQSFWGGASFKAFAPFTGGVVGDVYAPASQAFQVLVASTPTTGFSQLGQAGPGQALEPAFRGRFRLFGYLRLGPSGVPPWQVAADVVDNTGGYALASAGPVATVTPDLASANAGLSAYGGQPSPAYQIVDLGEVAWPPVASGAPRAAMNMRLFVAGSVPTAVGTITLRFGGFHLLPLDGAAGIVPRGLAQPTIAATVTNTRLAANGINGWAALALVATDLGTTSDIVQDALRYQQGGPPVVGASTTRLDVNAAARVNAAATGPLVHTGGQFAAVSVSYQPRFAFAKGI